MKGKTEKAITSHNYDVGGCDVVGLWRHGGHIVIRKREKISKETWKLGKFPKVMSSVVGLPLLFIIWARACKFNLLAVYTCRNCDNIIFIMASSHTDSGINFRYLVTQLSIPAACWCSAALPNRRNKDHISHVHPSWSFLKSTSLFLNVCHDVQQRTLCCVMLLPFAVAFSATPLSSWSSH